MSRLFRIGTRRSLLALAQSSLMKRALEAANPDVKITLTGMDTEGDEIHQNRFSELPLHALDGKNFFVKELDEALLAGRTDISIHSYKDLSLDRPEGLLVAAVPPRANPRDILLFHPRALAKLEAGGEIIIGSSSPRRAENTPPFLKMALPLQSPEIRMVPIRGNVNTRLKKLHEHVDGMDGIILAFAGLSRLMGEAEMQPLLQGIRFMVLPLDACPTAPAQGALALECRADDAETIALLKSSHCAATAASIARERAVLKQHGGGCHQAFGATVTAMGNESILFVRGKSDAGSPLDITEFSKPVYGKPTTAWNGSAHRAAETETLPIPTTQSLTPTIFITHHRAATPQILPLLKGKRIWTSGTKSWQKLAAMGLLVEGSAENLGFDSIRAMLGDKLLALPPLHEWTILTHEDGADSWNEGNVIATYRIKEAAAEPAGLKNATHIWWASGSQFRRLNPLAAQAKFHACGPGKTAAVLQEHGITPDIFPSNASWLAHIK